MKKIDNDLLQSERQIELLGKHFPIDKEKKIITVTYRYEKASDFLLTDVGNKDCPQFSPDFLERLNNTIKRMPLGYRLEIKFDVSDYEGYDPNVVMSSFEDALELNQYSWRKQRRNKWLLATILILIGIIMLMFMVFGSAQNWFGEGIQSSIITEIIDIAAWVFIWEGVYMLFLEPSEQGVFSMRVQSRVSNVSFYKKDNGQPLVTKSISEIISNWMNEGKLKNLGKIFLLVASAAFIALFFINVIEIYTVIDSKALAGIELTVFLIIEILLSVLHLFAGLGGLGKYNGRKGFFSKFVGPYCIVLTVFVIASIVTSIIFKRPSMVVANVSSLVFVLFYISGYFINRVVK